MRLFLLSFSLILKLQVKTLRNKYLDVLKLKNTKNGKVF